MEWPPPSVVIRLYASIDGFNLVAAKVDRGADKRSKHSCGLRITSNKQRGESKRE